MKTKLYAQLAMLICARLNCISKGNSEWEAKHEEQILSIVKDTAPSGSGIDCGTKINLDDSAPEKLVFDFSYHHMNDGGYYDGWTEHRLIVTPSLQFGCNLKITGKDRNDTKEYLHEVYSYWLNSDAIEQTVAA